MRIETFQSNKIHTQELALLYHKVFNRWKRLLLLTEKPRWVIEINLTARPGFLTDWDRVRDIEVFEYKLKRPADVVIYRGVVPTSDLYQAVVEAMRSHLSDQETEDLLYKDYLSPINWKKFHSVENKPRLFREVCF